MKSGFTLIEMLIVVGLIGVLSVIGINMYLSAQRQGRDTRRVSDLTAIQKSLESYYVVNGEYPNGCNPGATYLPQGMPRDPVTNAVYSSSSCTASAYCFCVQLQNTTTGGNSTVNNCTNYASGSFFCVSNVQ